MPSFKHFMNICKKIHDEKPYFVGQLGFGGHLELPNDANLASSRFQIRIPIINYFCKNIFCRRYCMVHAGLYRELSENAVVNGEIHQCRRSVHLSCFHLFSIISYLYKIVSFDEKQRNNLQRVFVNSTFSPHIYKITNGENTGFSGWFKSKFRLPNICLVMS